MARTVESVGINVDLRKNFIRGAARLVIADMTTAFPSKLSDIIRMVSTAQDEVQSLAIAGTPTGGTFILAFKGYTTSPIVYNASAATVQAALEVLSSIGTGGVVCTGGALPGAAVTITFANQQSGSSQPLISAISSLTGGTTPTVAVTRTTAGFGIYEATGGWANGDMGATKGGITIARNNAEETFDVDQIQADIMSLPTTWTMTVAASVAQNDIDTIQYLWEGGTIVVDVTTGERTLPLGTPTVYRRKRLCVLFQRQSFDGGSTVGLIRAYCFRITTRTPQESSIVHNKTGDQVNVPFTWNALADTNITDNYARFGSIIDQA
jgi:hypothetical protein